jgi:hypothetical protein
MAQNLVLNILARDKTRAAFRGIKAGLTNLRASIFSVQSALIGIGGGLVIRSIIKVGRDVEELGLRFNFLFGNVEQGKKAFKGLIDFAARVPFSLEEIAAGSGNLAVVAKDADELNKIMKITGNVAAVTGLDFRTTSEQIQRSFSAGIGAADLFRDRGVRALLGFKAGATVTTEETVKRFEELFGEDGRFSKATEVLATTFTGTLSMLGDKLFKFKLETNQAGFFDFVKNALVVVNKLIEQNSKVMTGFATMVGTTLVNVVKQAMMGVARLLDMFSMVFKAVALGIGGTIDLVKALPAGVRELGIIGFLMLGRKGKMLVVAISGLVKLLGIDLEKISEKLFGAQKDTEAWGKHSEGVAKFIKMVEENMKLSAEQMKELEQAMNVAKEEAEEIKLSMQKVADVVGQQIKKDFESINNTVGKMILGGVKNFSRALAEAVVLGKQLNQSLKELAQKLLVDILAFAIQLVLQRQIENFLIEKGLIAEKKKTAEIKKQNKELMFQAALRMFTGGGGKAMGGAVSKGKPVVVGERGPELFVPNSTGQITQNARGTGGGSVNVNFSITTLDATGFSEMLAQNRGTITSIINNAMNEKGSRGII